MLVIDDIKIEDCDRQLCERYCRVMGYYRPVSQFNKGKQSEYAERVFFEEAAIKPKLTVEYTNE